MPTGIGGFFTAQSVVGALTARQMYAINSSTVDIVSNWLPSVRVLGDLRATTITYRAIVRSRPLASDEAGVPVLRAVGADEILLALNPTISDA
jgi:hypothetical protein